jgi:hypothetical protein
MSDEGNTEKLPVRLVATRLPAKLADRVQRAAEQQMISIAAYTRQAPCRPRPC